MKRVALFGFILFSVAMGGCGGPAFHRPLDAEQARAIKTIGVITVPQPTENLGGAGLDKAGFDFSRPMTAALEQALRRAGYRVVILPAANRLGSDFVGNYESYAGAAADAILDTRVVFAGYAAEITPNPKRFHRPYIHLHARLLNTKTRQVVFEEMASLVGPDITVAGRTIPTPWKDSAPDKHHFRVKIPAPDPGPFVAAREAAIAGLMESMTPVAEALIGGLKAN